ncbi:MalY/PatB family protein [Vagococcus zengguangii]|uniref:cysteine-S-conjugate beta-lyase n=1 Tax=Vagococcus zengguangii TaxID=2571750 RepID=A0A4D7CRG0_9ENTE|nr:aminotransferase class I/II-fold pyridoxal phosphate-dependent enzyme [Vagococcus zengguangii]QCI86649.1 aminotransferase class I/II-fold pyridoxal phosphate-dependent enzyme [Vagococcus zengguangii]
MNNVVQVISTVVRALTAEEDNILVLTPSYGPLINTPTAAKRHVIKVPMTCESKRYQVDMASFEQAIIEHDIKIFILCNPQNPTGRVWTHAELTELFKICQRHQVKVLADEIHSDLIYPDQTFVPAMQVAREVGWEQQLVVANAPTKTFNLAGLQAAYYIVENPEFIELIEQERAYASTGNLLGVFAYLGIETSYSYGEDYVDTMMSYIQDNYRYVEAELARELPEAKIVEAEATYLIWVDISYLAEKGITMNNLKSSLAKHGVAISTGEDFYEDQLFLRVNIGCPKATLTEGVARLISGLKNLSE